VLWPGDGAQEGEAEGTHAVETAGFERGVGFFKAEVSVCGPVDFVPLQVAGGFCGDIFVRDWINGYARDGYCTNVYLLSNLRRF
jgi:hypothetical protein